MSFTTIILVLTYSVITFARQRIVGGHLINITETPYQVSLQLSGKHICGGSVISSKFILTAAHCTEHPHPQLYTIRVGSATSFSGGKSVQVKRIQKHPNYKSYSDHSYIDYDYSLLELSTDLQFDASTRSILLPASNEKIAEGLECFISGWGKTMSPESHRDFSVLRATSVNIIGREKCVQAYANKVRVTPRMVCAGVAGGGKDACMGDSGGPMVCNGMLIGVVSFGIGCGNRKYPGVYGSVAMVRDWILSLSGV